MAFFRFKLILKKVSLILTVLFVVFVSCGIEDSLYFQEPRFFEIGGSEFDLLVYFYGHNQEKDNEKYLFVGYDIYYYFDNIANAKRAQVRDPSYTLPRDGEKGLIDFTDAVRFPPDNYGAVTDIYKDVSFPVTIQMIEDVLYEGNNQNVVFTLRKTGSSSPTNPFIDANRVILEQLYPNYNDYYNQIWGSLDPDFLGFYDADFYKYFNIQYNAELSPNPDLYKTYEVNFYVIAKGFNSDHERTKNFTRSISSSVVRLNISVDQSTLHP